MRRFVLDRHVDKSEVSGLGIVAEGIVFSDGTVSLRWLAGAVGEPSVGFYDTLRAVETIHGHEGTTQTVWVD